MTDGHEKYAGTRPKREHEVVDRLAKRELIQEDQRVEHDERDGDVGSRARGDDVAKRDQRGCVYSLGTLRSDS